jgi:hypothetical protein
MVENRHHAPHQKQTNSEPETLIVGQLGPEMEDKW